MLPPRSLDAEVLRAVLREQLPAALRDVLPAARWYGDKGKPIVELAIDELALATDAPLAFAVARVRFAEGESRYLLPLALSPAAELAVPALLTVATRSGDVAVGDALLAPSFPDWLLASLAGGAPLLGERGRFEWRRLPTAGDSPERARGGPATVSGAEQSNSAIRYDDALFAKLFRRLRAGVNPDEEISRHLAERTEFANLPRPVASGAYLTSDGTSAAVAFAQAFVPSLGDGWSWTLGQLGALLDREGPTAGPVALLGPWLEAARLLGQRTAQLHRALAFDAGDPAFTPEAIDASRIRGWDETLRLRLILTVDELVAARAELPPPLRTLVGLLQERMPSLLDRASGFAEQRGGVAVRVHGDYHLGQVLKTVDDWIVLDFEGEPARSLAERRTKTSVLKDVAGMLRSFAYARGAALRSLPMPSDERSVAAADWDAESRAAFLDGYRAAMGGSLWPLVPTDPETFARALAAWELDKAVYEIDYERRNRPDWLDIPLAALLREG